MKRICLLLGWFLLWTATIQAQPCPSNIGFEQGTLDGWQCYTGANRGLNNPVTWVAGPAIPGRHSIMSGSGMDLYGGFPVVAPDGGNYSLKLGNNMIGAETEKVVYTVHIPPGKNSYALFYQYALVLQDPNHSQNEQPFFKMVAYDSLTGHVIACDSSMFISNSSLPGFRPSRWDSGTLYRDWSTGTLPLNGLAGRAVCIAFTTADCMPAAHFGYAYVDVKCAESMITTLPCATATGNSLTGPPGYQTYQWYDNSYALIDTGKTIQVSQAPADDEFNLVAIPYPGFGCADTISARISLKRQITIADTLLQPICNGHGGMIRVQGAGGTGRLQYAWNTVPPANVPQLDSLSAGTYIVTVTDSLGCTGNDTIVLTDHPIPVIGCSANSTRFCNGGTITLLATGASSYRWSPATGLSCTGCAAPAVTLSSDISYTVTGTDTNGCTGIAGITLPVMQHGPTSVDSGLLICPGGAGAQLGASGGIVYEWSPPQNLDNAHISNPRASPPANSQTNYRVIIKINDCFTDTLYQQVAVHPAPVIDIGNGLSGVPGQTFTLYPVTNAPIIRWTPPDGLSCTDCLNPVVTLNKDIIYMAEVTDDHGCKATDTMFVDVRCDASYFFMANTFTPNGDGRNDYFFPQAHGDYKVKRFMIYSRWGEIVFSTEGIPANEESKGWNGQFRGKDLAPDVFVYVMETECTDGTPVVLKGDVTLVR